MSSSYLQEELECSICLNIFTDPVTLKCGHNFWKLLDTQKGSGGFSCLECREEFQDWSELQRNISMHKLLETLQTTPGDQDQTGDLSKQCIHTPVPAAKSCLHCEASLCDNHLRVHSKSPEHALCDPTTSLENREHSVHKKILEYDCTEDSAFFNVSCTLARELWGHQVETLNGASKKKNKAKETKKKKLGTVLQTPITKREETEKNVQSLQESRTSEILRRWLEELAKCSLSNRIQQLQDKGMSHTEKLCNMTDLKTVLHESGTGDLCDTEGGDDEKSDMGDFCDTEDGDDEESETGDLCDTEDGDDEESETGDLCDTEDGDDEESETGDLCDTEDGDDEESETGDLCDTEDGDDEESETGDLCDTEDGDDEESDMGDLCDTEDGDDEESDMGDLCDTEDGDDKESDTGDLCDTEDRERHDKLLHDGGDLDVAGVSHTLHTGLSDIMSGVNVQKCTDTHVYPHSTTKGKGHTKLSRPCPKPDSIIQPNIEALHQTLGVTDILLDVDTAGNRLHISDDRKIASFSFESQNRPETPERFTYPQVMSSQSFSKGRHYWELDVESENWGVGVGYKNGGHSVIGNNKTSWSLEKWWQWDNQYAVIHDSKHILIPGCISSSRIGIYLDYEAGQISFYELCYSIRHLHTFTEPLHAALWVCYGSIRLCRG